MASARSALPLLAFCVLAAAAFWRQPSRPVWSDRVESSKETRYIMISKYARRIFCALGMTNIHNTCAAQTLAKSKENIEGTAGPDCNPNHVSMFEESSPGCHSVLGKANITNPNASELTKRHSTTAGNQSTSKKSQRAPTDTAAIDHGPPMTQMQPLLAVSVDDEMTNSNRNIPTKQPFGAGIGKSATETTPDPVVDIKQPRMYRPAPIGQKASVRHARSNLFASDRTMALWPSLCSPEYGSCADIDPLSALGNNHHRCAQRGGSTKAAGGQRCDGLSLFTSDIFC
ncbi:hypothetical protein IW138_000992 [Coemansia sp. RSA 986]|nr:hypothetical protein IW138_000992 [Coemansia sp. RSA 986]